MDGWTRTLPGRGGSWLQASRGRRWRDGTRRGEVAVGCIHGLVSGPRGHVVWSGGLLREWRALR